MKLAPLRRRIGLAWQLASPQRLRATFTGLPREIGNWLALIGRALVLERRWFVAAFLMCTAPLLILVYLYGRFLGPDLDQKTSPFVYTMQ